jgi:hypothetical protein
VNNDKHHLLYTHPNSRRHREARMKIACACGATIHDAGDGLPGKAHIVPDASLFPLMDAFDEILLKRCTTQGEREAACTEQRRLLIKATRSAWQCAHCGRLYIDDAARQLNIYAPEGAAATSVFAAVQDGKPG